MKASLSRFVALTLMVLTTPVWAQIHTSALVGARRHQPGHLASVLPYGRNDYSVLAALQFHDRDAYWQIGLDFGWDPTGSPTAEYVLTPQLHLFFKGNVIAIGLGVMKSYIRDDARDKDWSPIYYEAKAGFEIPMGRLGLTVMAAHPFRKWADIGNIKERDLEYTAGLSWRF